MPFSPEDLALVEAVHADPRNDELRLAYAEWLQTNSQETLSEFVRWQLRRNVTFGVRVSNTGIRFHNCWIKRLGDAEPEYQEFQQAVGDKFYTQVTPWLRPFPRGSWNTPNVLFHRGMPTLFGTFFVRTIAELDDDMKRMRHHFRLDTLHVATVDETEPPADLFAHADLRRIDRIKVEKLFNGDRLAEYQEYLKSAPEELLRLMT